MISDHAMPGSSGLDPVSEIHAGRAGLPIVTPSGFAVPVEEQALLAALAAIEGP